MTIAPTYTDETVEIAKSAITTLRDAADAVEKPPGGNPVAMADTYRSIAARYEQRLAAIPRPSTGSDAGDLVKRLIDLSNHLLRLDSLSGEGYLTREAAASIAALSEENERLKAGLAPFGKVTVLYREGVAWSLDDPDLDDLSIGELYIRAVDLRRAAALAKLGQMKGEG